MRLSNCYHLCEINFKLHIFKINLQNVLKSETVEVFSKVIEKLNMNSFTEKIKVTTHFPVLK